MPTPLSLSQFGLCALKFCLGPLMGSTVSVGVDLVEDLTCFDLGALFKQALLQNARDLRPHFRDTVSGGSARQFHCKVHTLRLHLNNPDFRRRRRRPFSLCLTGELSQPASNKAAIHIGNMRTPNRRAIKLFSVSI